MKNASLVIVLSASILIACTPATPSPFDIQTAIAQTQIVLPTTTAYPTYTPPPTLTPEIIFITPTALPEFVKLFDFTGTGKGTSDLFSLEAGIVKITWKYTDTDSDNFAFYLKRLDTDGKELIENTIGDSEGQVILKVGASSQYLIDVKYASGDWAITIYFMPSTSP